MRIRLGLLTVMILQGACYVSLNSIFPSAGPLAGGTKVTVSGGPFAGMEASFPFPKCKFGRDNRVVSGAYVPCQTQKKNESKQICIECDESPASDVAEKIPLTVSLTGDFSDVSNSVPFMYYLDPEITYAHPNHGFKTGSTRVQI